MKVFDRHCDTSMTFMAVITAVCVCLCSQFVVILI